MKCDISMSVSTVKGRARKGVLAVVNMRTAYPFSWVENNVCIEGHKSTCIIVDLLDSLNKYLLTLAV